MTWSISVSGTKEEAKRGATSAFRVQSGMQLVDLQLVHAAIDAQPGQRVTVHAQGYLDPSGGSLSITASSYT